MHILFLIPSYPISDKSYGGIFFKKLADQIGKTHVVGVIAPMFESVRNLSKKSIDKSISIHEQENHIAYVTQAYNWFGRHDFYISKKTQKLPDKLYKQYIKDKGVPDVIHAHVGMFGGWNAKFLKQKYNIPFVLTEHSTQVLNKALTPSRTKMYRSILESASRVCAVGNALSESIKDQFGVKPEVIPNFVDLNKFKILPNVKSTDNRILAVGNLIPIKRFDLLIESFAEVTKSFPDLKLHIIGSGPQKSELDALITQKGLSDSILLCGKIDNNKMSEQYNMAKVVVSSSDVETFGVACAEALACGVPLVATKSGGPEDFVTETNGILCPTGDKQALTDAIILVLKKLEENQYNNKTISEAIGAKCGGDAIVNNYTRIYESVLA